MSKKQKNKNLVLSHTLSQPIFYGILIGLLAGIAFLYFSAQQDANPPPFNHAANQNDI